VFYVNDFLEKLMFEELKHHSASQGMDLYACSLSIGARILLSKCNLPEYTLFSVRWSSYPTHLYKIGYDCST